MFQNSISGMEIVNFLISRKQCKSREEAKVIGQNLVDTHILVPVMKNEEDEGTEEIKPFEGNSELYYVNESILEVNESGKSVSDPSLPIKEHNQIVRMSGYLTTTSNSRSRVSCR